MSYLYMNGIIDIDDETGEYYVRFSCPFVQKRLFEYFSDELFRYMGRLVEPFETLGDVLTLQRHLQAKYLKIKGKLKSPKFDKSNKFK